MARNKINITKKCYFGVIQQNEDEYKKTEEW